MEHEHRWVLVWVSGKDSVVVDPVRVVHYACDCGALFTTVDQK